MKKSKVHPYIPNSVPEVKEEMLREVGARDADELYRQMIPDRLLLKRPLDLPDPLTSELDLRRHVEGLMAGDGSCSEYLSFLGGGCWNHYVPEVCDVIASRSEFLTAYAGGVYSDLGRYQAIYEFQSLIGELVDMDVSCIPTYDWGAAAGNAVRIASRITGRKEILVPKTISPARLSIISNFCDSANKPDGIIIKSVGYDRETGALDLNDLEDKISDSTAGVYFENPSYLGVIEPRCEEITGMTHDHGAIAVAGVDPISLGVLSPPGEYDADICCGEAQPLGIHMYAGGGSCGFLASKDEERFVGEYPARMLSVTDTEVDGEYAYGQVKYERTSYIARESAKDWVGTTTGLWAIVSAVYMSLMGPRGMRELGEGLLQRSHYAARLLEEVEGVSVPFRGFFKEFPVNFDAAGVEVSEVNRRLLEEGIFGGQDVSETFPELGQCGLYCITERHTKADLKRLAVTLREVL
ncbi:putative glycine dehydrogenase (decarboxylating) subunit 1 [subsurface metagenome]